MHWWIWIISGFVVLLLEFFLPSGLFLFFTGVSGIITGLLVLAGLLSEAWVQWCVCALLAVLLLVLLRKSFLKFGAGHEVGLGILGKEVIILSDEIKPGEVGKGEMRGSHWVVRNDTEKDLKKNDRVRAAAMVGNTLSIK